MAPHNLSIIFIGMKQTKKSIRDKWWISEMSFFKMKIRLKLWSGMMGLNISFDCHGLQQIPYYAH